MLERAVLSFERSVFKAVARILGTFHDRRLRDGVNNNNNVDLFIHISQFPNLIVFYVLYLKKQAFYIKV